MKMILNTDEEFDTGTKPTFISRYRNYLIETGSDNPHFSGNIQPGSRLGDNFSFPQSLTELELGYNWKWKAYKMGTGEALVNFKYKGKNRAYIKTEKEVDFLALEATDFIKFEDGTIELTANFGDGEIPCNTEGVIGYVAEIGLGCETNIGLQEIHLETVEEYGYDYFRAHLFAQIGDLAPSYVLTYINRAEKSESFELKWNVELKFVIRKVGSDYYKEGYFRYPGVSWKQVGSSVYLGSSFDPDSCKPVLFVKRRVECCIRDFKIEKGNYNDTTLGNYVTETSFENTPLIYTTPVLRSSFNLSEIREIKIKGKCHSSTRTIKSLKIYEDTSSATFGSGDKLLRLFNREELLEKGMTEDGKEFTIIISERMGSYPLKYIDFEFTNDDKINGGAEISFVEISYGLPGSLTLLSTCNLKWTTIGRMNSWSDYPELEGETWEEERHSLISIASPKLGAKVLGSEPTSPSDYNYFISDSDIDKRAVILKFKLPEKPKNAKTLTNINLYLNVRDITYPFERVGLSEIKYGNIDASLVLVRLKDDKLVIIPSSDINGKNEKRDGRTRTDFEKKGCNWRSKDGAEDVDESTWVEADDRGFDGAGEDFYKVNRCTLASIDTNGYDLVNNFVIFPFNNMEDLNWGDEVSCALFISKCAVWDYSQPSFSFIIDFNTREAKEVKELGDVLLGYFELEYEPEENDTPSNLEIEAVDTELESDKAPFHTGFVRLKWEKPNNVDNFSSYVVYRKKLEGGTYEVIGEIKDYRHTYFTDRTDLDELTYYYYKVGIFSMNLPFDGSEKSEQGARFSNEVKVYRPKSFIIAEQQDGLTVSKTFEKIYIGVGWTYTPSEEVDKSLELPKYVHIDWGDDSWDMEELKLKRVIGFEKRTGYAIIQLDNTVGLETGDYVSIHSAFITEAEPKSNLFKIIEKDSSFIKVEPSVSLGFIFDFTDEDIKSGVYVQQAFSHVYTQHGSIEEDGGKQLFLITAAVVLPNKYRSKFSSNMYYSTPPDAKKEVYANTPVTNMITVPLRVNRGKELVFDLSDSDTLDEKFSFSEGKCYEFVTKGSNLTNQPPELSTFRIESGSIPAGMFAVRAILKDDEGKFTPFSKLLIEKFTIPSRIYIDVYAPCKGTLYFFIGLDETEHLELSTIYLIVPDEGTFTVEINSLSGTGSFIDEDIYLERFTSHIPYVSKAMTEPAGIYRAYGRVRNRKGSYIKDWQYSDISTVYYEIVEPIIIDFSELTDGYQSRDLEAGLDTSTEMSLGNKPINVTNVRKVRVVSISGKAVTIHPIHPILEVHNWAVSKGLNNKNIPDDILTLMYIEEMKAMIKIEHEGREWVYNPGNIRRPRDTDEITVHKWTIEAFEEEYLE